jgi:hypothetical protein
MTIPSLSNPINNLREVLESGLPWEMVIYGDEAEVQMAKSENPFVKRMWAEKVEVKFAPTPQVHMNYPIAWSMFFSKNN